MRFLSGTGSLLLLGSTVLLISKCCDIDAFVVIVQVPHRNWRATSFLDETDCSKILPSQQHHPRRLPPRMVLLWEGSKQDDDNDNDEETIAPFRSPPKTKDIIDPIPTLPLTYLGAAIVFVMFWPCLAFLRINWGYNPISGFDVDMFLALKGILDNTDAASTGSSSMAMDGGLDTILELPPLSPAEQLVGAIFGPP